MGISVRYETSSVPPMQRLELNGIGFSHVFYPPNLRILRHAHERAHIGFLVRGAALEDVEGGVFTKHAGSIVVKYPGCPHTHEFGPDGVEAVVLDFDNVWFERWSQLAAVLKQSSQIYHFGWATLFHRIRSELIQPDSLTELSLEGAVFELMAGLGRLEFDVRPNWLKKARNLLQDSYAQHLTLGTVSLEVGVHPVHLARTFRRQFGCSIGEYVRQVRVERAKSLLTSTNQTLAGIAQQVGFADEPHFSRTFKRQMGMTPGKFRNVAKAR